MIFLEISFWLCGACVIYAYGIYPIALLLVGRVRRRPFRPTDPPPTSISVVVPAHNEERFIGRRVREFKDLICRSGLEGEVVVISDGSTDRTAAVAREHGGSSVRVLEFPVKMGKAAGLTQARAAARGKILVFADARQSWAPDTLERLLENFRDPSVGAV